MTTRAGEIAEPDDAAVFDPLSPAFRRDPYPTYERLRSADPVHRSPLGFWVLTRYADVAALLRDPRFSQARPWAQRVDLDAPMAQALGRSMLFTDGAHHTRLRKLVSKAFTPRVVEGMAGLIRQIADELLDRLEHREEMDVIADFAYPLPVRVISELLGIPAADSPQLREWAEGMSLVLDPATGPDALDRATAAFSGFADYVGGLVDQRRRTTTGDLVSRLIAVSEQGDALSDAELLGVCRLLLLAGHVTTVNLIGNGVLALLRHPHELALLRADPSLAPSAVEEILRFDSPAQLVGKVATEDVSIDGRSIAQGELVVGVLGAANRDPDHFAAPDRLDIGRTDNRHLSFGGGPHFCLGAPLARLEGRIALQVLISRLPSLELATDDLEWQDSITLKGLKALPVTFTRSA